MEEEKKLVFYIFGIYLMLLVMNLWNQNEKVFPETIKYDRTGEIKDLLTSFSFEGHWEKNKDHN